MTASPGGAATPAKRPTPCSATLLALSALAGWNLTLRRRVKARTVALTRSIDQANAARDQLEATLAAVPDLLFEIDADGRYIDCRANRADLLIAPPEQLIGRLIRDSMPAEAADVAMAAVQEAVRDGQSSGRQMRLPLPDGEHWFELSAARKGGTATGDDRVVVLSRDITDRKRAELALRQSEHSFRQFFDAGLVGMAITVPGQQWSQCNARLAEMLGYEVDELARMTWVELTHPEDLPADMAHFERVMAGETDGYTMDKRFIRKDGRIVDAAIAVRCERDAQGQAVRFFAIVEDISARKQAEQALERHSEQLEAQVALRSRELVQARDQAQAASRAKSELLSRMSHELRTPMNAILGFSQLLEVDRSLPDTARRFVTEILRAGQHLLNLINDVLDLAHVESGRISLSPEALDLHDFLPEVLTLLQPLARSARGAPDPARRRRSGRACRPHAPEAGRGQPGLQRDQVQPQRRQRDRRGRRHERTTRCVCGCATPARASSPSALPACSSPSTASAPSSARSKAPASA